MSQQIETTMKTELQIHSITLNKNKTAYEVDYSLVDENITDVTQTITIKTLVAHAFDQAMNVWNDGEKQITDHLLTYVTDNYELVIEDLILTHAVAE